MIFHINGEMKQKVNKIENNHNSSDSLVFGRLPQTKMLLIISNEKVQLRLFPLKCFSPQFDRNFKEGHNFEFWRQNRLEGGRRDHVITGETDETFDRMTFALTPCGHRSYPGAWFKIKHWRALLFMWIKTLVIERWHCFFYCSRVVSYALFIEVWKW